jgi:hydroxymethylpyrimidine pyrophosphatase-like HAD family hydrolase
VVRRITLPARPPRPIRLLVVDIDGCLVPVEHAAYDVEGLARLASYNRRSREDEVVPVLTILSGRPHPYVDALMQVLDIRVPAIFENGAGLAMRSPYGARYRPEVDRGKSDLQTLSRELAGAPGLTVQPGKSASLTVFPADADAGIGGLKELLERLLERHSLELLIDPAQECVNVLVPGVDKGLGLRWLAEELQVPLGQVAGIGDSVGDLAWLSLCGLSWAPANAERPVRSQVEVVSPHRDIAAVLELYEAVIESNRSAPEPAPEGRE